MERVVTDNAQTHLGRTDLEVVEPEQTHSFQVLTVTATETVEVHKLLSDTPIGVVHILTLAIHQVIPQDGLSQEVPILHRFTQTLVQSSVLGDQGILTCCTDCRWQLVHLCLNEGIQLTGYQLLVFRLSIITHRRQLPTFDQRPDGHALVAVTDGLDFHLQTTLFSCIGSGMKFSLSLNGTLLTGNILTSLCQFLRQTSQNRAYWHTTSHQLQHVRHHIGYRHNNRLDDDQGLRILNHTLQSLFSVNKVSVCLVTKGQHGSLTDSFLSLLAPVGVTSPGITHSCRAVADHVIQHIFTDPEATIRELSMDSINSRWGEQLESILNDWILVMQLTVEQIYILCLVGRVVECVLTIHLSHVLNTDLVRLNSQSLFSKTTFPSTHDFTKVSVVIEGLQHGRISRPLISHNVTFGIVHRQQVRTLLSVPTTGQGCCDTGNLTRICNTATSQPTHSVTSDGINPTHGLTDILNDTLVEVRTAIHRSKVVALRSRPIQGRLGIGSFANVTAFRQFDELFVIRDAQTHTILLQSWHVTLVVVHECLTVHRVPQTGQLLIVQTQGIAKGELHPSLLALNQGTHCLLVCITEHVYSVERDQRINGTLKCRIHIQSAVIGSKATSDGTSVTGQMLTRNPGHHEGGQLLCLVQVLGSKLGVQSLDLIFQFTDTTIQSRLIAQHGQSVSTSEGTVLNHSSQVSLTQSNVHGAPFFLGHLTGELFSQSLRQLSTELVTQTLNGRTNLLDHVIEVSVGINTAHQISNQVM